jgi:hypothetical protein
VYEHTIHIKQHRPDRPDLRTTLYQPINPSGALWPETCCKHEYLVPLFFGFAILAVFR